MPRAANSSAILREHRGGSAVDLGDRARVQHEPLGAGREFGRDGAQPRLDVVGVEEQQVALNDADCEAGLGSGLGRAMQLVEAVAARNAAEQRVAGIHRLVAGGRRGSHRSR